MASSGARLRQLRVPARGGGRAAGARHPGPHADSDDSIDAAGASSPEPSSPLSPWGAMFALWGRDEMSDAEIQALATTTTGDAADSSSKQQSTHSQHTDSQEEDGSDPIIHAIMSFDHGVPNAEETMRFVEANLLCHKRFCKRLILPRTRWGQPSWAPTKVDVRQHVRSFQLEAPPQGTDPLAKGTALHSHIEAFLGKALPMDRPPWEVQVLSYPEGSGNPGGVMLWRIHHSIGDGISLASLLLSLADGGPPPLPGEQSERSSAGGGRATSHSCGPLQWLFRALSAPWGLFWNTAAALLHTLFLLIVADLPSAVRADGERYRKKCRRAVAISEEVSVAELKAVGRAAGATLNDVLMAAMSEALARYEVLHGYSADRCHRLNFVMAVNTRPIKGIQAEIAASARGEDTHWGNQVGMILGALPLFESDGSAISPRERLSRIHRMLSNMKKSLGPIVLTWVLQLIQRCISLASGYMVVNHLMYNATTLLSNVPGPQVPVWLVGKQVTGICNVVNGTPQGTCFSFLSYDGGLRLAMASSQSVVSDPSELTRLFEEALRCIGDSVGVPLGREPVQHPPAAFPSSSDG